MFTFTFGLQPALTSDGGTFRCGVAVGMDYRSEMQVSRIVDQVIRGTTRTILLYINPSARFTTETLRFSVRLKASLA